MEIRIRAVQFVESFNIKKFRADFCAEAHSGSTSEVFLCNVRYGALFIRF
ncbi:hypothetical protein [Flavobacterium xueshanense]|nr:hypothetical protein [Flavobacterium xueshanense]